MKVIRRYTRRDEVIGSLLLIPTIGAIVLFGYFAVQYYGDEVGVYITIVLLIAIFPALAIVFNILAIVKIKKKNTNLNSLDTGSHEIVGKIKPIGKLVKSPTGINCVYYASFWIDTVYEGSGEHRNALELLVKEKYENCTFVIEDEYDKIELDLTNLKTELIRFYDINKKKLKNSGSANPIGNVRSENYEEVVMMPNDDFYFNGTIEEVIKNDFDETSVISVPPLLTEIPTGKKLFKIIKAELIGNKSEKKLIKKKINIIIIALFIFIVFFMIALGLHSTKFME